jgi:3-hydroxybutyrate dehydrogenase/3-oxoacyl-[acyl-carrier protein] reductase
LIDDTVARYGRVDILVNNAGGSSGHAPVGLLSDEAWNEACNWILNSTFWATRRVLEGMKERGFGRIINISSVESKFMNKASISNYSVFKAAVNALARCVAVEYSPFGVTANSICPGAIETDLMLTAGAKTAEVLGITYQQFLDNYAQESLTKRLNTVEEVAAVAVLLASPEGLGISGTTINVDGGTSPF